MNAPPWHAHALQAAQHVQHVQNLQNLQNKNHSENGRGRGEAMNQALFRLRTTVRGHGCRIRRALGRRGRDVGMSTAEYAVGTIAACAFAAVLYKVVTSGPVSEALQQLVERALDATF